MSNLSKISSDIIKKWEGCHKVRPDGLIEAYPDPASGGEPWTIGWGSTRDLNGRAIRKGDVIDRKTADLYLEKALSDIFIPAVKKIPHSTEFSDEQAAALVSFAYNLGAGFYGSEGFETISRQLRNKEWELIPKTLEMYSMPWDPKVHQGLLNRRKDEGRLWKSGLTPKNNTMAKQISARQNTVLKKKPEDSSKLTKAELVDVPKGRAYRITKIEPAANNHSKIELDFKAGTWFIFNPHWNGAEEIGQVVENAKSKTLKVRFFPQTDSRTSHALRMCFSSSCAMLADWLKPGCLGNDLNADDTYLTKYVLPHGDTILASSQLAALDKLGIEAEFRKNLTQQDVIDQINKGVCVPVGYLHHGPISDPRGGGHWANIVGYDLVAQVWIVHDPFGEADLVNGGFVRGKSGEFRRYSFRNFNRRWEVTPSGDYKPGLGWGIIAKR